MTYNQSDLEMDRALLRSYSNFLKKILEEDPKNISIKIINNEKFLLINSKDFDSLIEKFYEERGEDNW